MTIKRLALCVAVVLALGSIQKLAPVAAQIVNPTIAQFGVTPPGVVPRQFCARTIDGTCWPFLAQDPTTGRASTFYQAPFPGAVTMLQSAKDAQVIDAGDFGVVNDPNCATLGIPVNTLDQTAAMQAAFAAAAGGTLRLPRGAFICLNSTTPTIQVLKPMQIDMNGATIKFNAPAGTPVAPILDFRPGSDGWSLYGNGTFDGQNELITYADSVYFGTGGYRGAGDAAISIQSRGVAHDVICKNSFDSCFQIAAYDANNNIIPQTPSFGQMSNITTYGAGVGNHGTGAGEAGPGKGGVGVNNGSGHSWIFTNLIDFASYEGFGCDVGAGASCYVDGFVGISTQFDSSNPNGPTGNCLYNGAAFGSFSNIYCVNSGLRGISQDSGSFKGVWTNVTVDSPQQQCLQIVGNSSWFGVTCLNPSQKGSTVAPGVTIQRTGTNPLYVDIDGLDVINTGTPLESFGVYATGSNVWGHIHANRLNGTNAAYAFDSSVGDGLSIDVDGPYGLGVDKAAAGAGNPRDAGKHWNFGAGLSTTLALLAPTPVAALPSCTPSLTGEVFSVRDATNPTYGSTLTGNGSTPALALCNGTTWTAH